jgi:hypothetical protein
MYNVSTVQYTVQEHALKHSHPLPQKTIQLLQAVHDSVFLARFYGQYVYLIL